MENRTRLSSVLILAALVAGCQTQQQIVDSMQQEAVHTAQRRAVFEMNCPAATAEILGKEMVQSPVRSIRFAPPERGEYTVGAQGCGQRATYLVMCAVDGTGCFAGGSRNIIR